MDDRASLALRPELLILYDAGLESQPPWGHFLLSIEGRGSVSLANQLRGNTSAWSGSMDRVVIERLLAALDAAGFPHVDPHPIPAGSMLRVVSVQSPDREAHTYPIAWHALEALPGYREVFRILDSVVHELSGDALAIAPDGERGLVKRTSPE